jgi:uncharacterized protein YbjT (DUF2867 family)
MFRFIGLGCLITLLLACRHAELAIPLEQTSAVANVERLILVTGITGKQGGAVGRALLDKGFRVRGLSRKPNSDRAKQMASLGVEIVEGDFEDTVSLDRAMKNVDAVFLVTNFWEHHFAVEVQQGKNVVDAAARGRVNHLIFSSVAHADLKTGIPHFESKYEIEQYIHSKKIPFTILRPVSFMENWEYSREHIRAGKIVSPFSLATRMQQISVVDIGRFTALAFSEPEQWLGRSLDIVGDEYTMKELLHLFSEITQKPINLVQVPWQEHEKAQGKDMAMMDRWINETGYHVDIKAVRSELPGMLTLKEYLQKTSWR